MSTSTFVGNSEGTVVPGLCPAPPPPPPPPPVPGQVPAMRINAMEAPAIRRPQIVNNDVYEPPAAIQNAMLTKDKKPFTYTPGMGGKLDLSQIRSPRMARRVAKNANDEGIEGPPKSALETKPTPAPASNATANLFVQPQVAIPVFPTNVPPPPPGNRTPPTPPINRLPPNVTEKQNVEPVKIVTKAEAKVTPIMVTVQPSTPESPGTPTQVTLAKAPTPWLQNKNKPQEELPEWAKRTNANKQSTSPDSPTSPPVYTSVQQMQPPQQWQQTQQRPQSQQYPYQQSQQQPQQYQPQQPTQYTQYQQQQQKRPYSSPAVTSQGPQVQQQERTIPIRIEDRPSVFDVKHEAGHHQFKQPPSPHHQQRWGQPQNQNQVQVQHQPMVPSHNQPQPSAGGGYVIPIMIEGSEKKPANGPTSTVTYSNQPIIRNNVIENQTTKAAPQRGSIPVLQQSESGPVQSRSFRVLQKITDTDTPNDDVDPDQIRKLQLTEDDRVLMNKFKEQVDSDAYLHHEEDPRYRGAAIPSRAFRFLQTMTDSGDAPMAGTMPRGQTAVSKKQNRNSKSFEESQANLPPSEQQVQEPKKYMGGAIPSRSFRILQAMTAPESVATQENRQADYTCQTENNVPGNQQGVFFPPPCPAPFWNPEGGWWGYYPLPYPGLSNDPKNPYDPYSFHPDGTAYVYYPIYNQNYPGYPPYDPINGDRAAYANAYPHPRYVVPAPSQNDPKICNNIVYGQTGSNVTAPDIEPGSNVLDNRLQGDEMKISNDTRNLNPLPPWDRTNNVSRTASSNSNKDSDCTTALNITDEEEIPETMVPPEIDVEIPAIDDPVKKACPSTNLNVTVPNYTYIDASDSSDSTDTESHSDNESIMESPKSSCSDNATTDNTSSDSDDSDSYLAYSTGLNPHGRYEKDTERRASGTRSSLNESCDDRREPESPLNNVVESEDCNLNGEEEVGRGIEKSKTDSEFPHQLSVIYEDTEHAGSESPRPRDGRDVRKSKGTPSSFEGTDEPPDEADTTTVSVSLPLRFKFSVSENNEDVTTVIVGDSMIKPERSSGKDDGRGSKMQEQRAREKIENVSVDYRVGNDTTVDFTVKRETSESKCKARNDANERTRDDACNGKVKEKTEEEDLVVPQVNFTLRKNPSRLNRINCQETVETEFTIKSKKVVSRKEETNAEANTETETSTEKDVQDGYSVSTNTSTRSSDSSIVTVTKETSSKESISSTASMDAANYNIARHNVAEIHDFNKNVVKPEVVVSECTWGEDSSKVQSNDFLKPSVNTVIEEAKKNPKNDMSFPSKNNNEEDSTMDVDEKLGKEPKHLLSVQNSREETDDEDSGVTSDMSRMISEVDTDSECTSSKNIRKYQRTQTHSRLFKLLNDDDDDSVHREAKESNGDEPTSRREYLSLPLKPRTFNYDENYCSNYSSGLTSPDYSPSSEQSWRRLHEATNDAPAHSTPAASNVGRIERNGDASRPSWHPLQRNCQERVPCKEDPYYQAWKTPKSPGPIDNDVVPSLAFKILESRRPLWAYKVNVLCPRIKSTKNVPRALRSNKTTESSIVPPNPVPCSNPKTDHC